MYKFISRWLNTAHGHFWGSVHYQPVLVEFYWNLNTVKLDDKERFDKEQIGDKERFDKEQIGVKELFPVSNNQFTTYKDKEHLALRNNNISVTKKFFITKFNCT